MKTNRVMVLFILVALVGSASSSSAQVKEVRMHIAGYLCGN